MSGAPRRAVPAALLLAAGLACPALGQMLHLKAGVVDTRARTGLSDADAAVPAGTRLVVQLDGPLTPSRLESLARAGVRLGQYLPDHAYIVDGSGLVPATVARVGFVRWIGAFDDAWKIDPSFGRRPFLTSARQTLASVGVSQVAIVLFAGEATDAVFAEVERLGGAVLASNPIGSQWFIDARLPSDRVAALARVGSVQWVEDAPEGRDRNDTNRWIVQSNVSGLTPVWDRGIHGEGQIGGHIDSAPRTTSCYFTDTNPVGPTHRKLIAMRGSTTAGSHGTHTAGTFVGDNAPYGVYTTNDGIAFAAKLSFSNSSPIFSTPSTLAPRLLDAHNDGARVHTNSWGDDGTTAYTTWCAQIDQFTYDNEDNVVAFAVTNTSALKTPENSLNVLAVGASQDQPNQGNFCSGGAGPTADGRRKPETFAPGCSTVSASSGSACGTASSTGTSMACPAVSGAAILVRQYFTDGFYPSGAASPGNAMTPTGALIRAVVLNSSVDMTGIAGYPSNGEGWGRVLLDNALYFAGDTRDLVVADVRNAQGLATGAQTSYPINVVSTTEPLVVTLVWTAPAAAVNASNPIVNNLDLEVVGPGGTYLGNVFASGQSTTGGTADAKNNVEMVRLNAPPVGSYTVRVKGTAVNQGLQGYAIAVAGDLGTGCTQAGVGMSPSPVTVAAGGIATFSASGTGTAPLAYQWRRNGMDLANGGRFSGVDSPTLTINPVWLADAGMFDVVVSNGCGSAPSAAATLTVTCYANCDGSTVAPILNVNDFSCFLNRFAAGDTYANCDSSTIAPVLNVNDFTCFLNAFAAGCP
ncbi:MAG: S8 family serine peptidase [Phycisphaerae bacterium]|nr:S8 family serine peptidase [Phycisphaerae bacterium]